MLKVATIVGARPQFVKAGAFSRAAKASGAIQEVMIHTGQHYDENMSEIFFKEMEIPKPHYHLGIGGGKQGAMTGQMIEKIEELLEKERPAWVLVYGDTNSTLAAALAAVKLHIPVAHVEAGLRSFNKKMPEEVNRILTDHCSELLLTPTKRATDQLLSEGVPSNSVVEVGDVMYDTALYYQKKATAASLLERLSLEPKAFALATVHRAENCDDHARLSAIVDALVEISQSRLPVVFPLHPRTAGAMKACGCYEKAKKGLTLIDPIGYFDMIALESHASLILTDSGGVQKEAFFFKTPCVTLRDETEWMELVEVGANRIVGADTKAIIAAADASLTATDIDWTMPLYGSGNATEKSVRTLLERQ